MTINSILSLPSEKSFNTQEEFKSTLPNGNFNQGKIYWLSLKHYRGKHKLGIKEQQNNIDLYWWI